MTEDVGDPKQVKAKKSKHQLAREQEIADLHAILQTYGGRAFIWRVLEQCELYRAAPGGSEAMARQAGKRDLGLWTIEELDVADGTAYSKMRDEAVTRQTKQKGK